MPILEGTNTKIELSKYPELNTRYEEAQKIQPEPVRAEALKVIDRELAERMILDNGHKIEVAS